MTDEEAKAKAWDVLVEVTQLQIDHFTRMGNNDRALHLEELRLKHMNELVKDIKRQARR